MSKRINIRPSARKHGFRNQDILHALGSAFYHLAEFEPSRVPNAQDPHLFLGRTGDGITLEVMLSEEPSETVVFHCMRAREKFLRLWRDGQST